MFRTSLKRNRRDYSATHKTFEETLDSTYMSIGVHHDLSMTDPVAKVTNPTVNFVPAAYQSTEEQVPTTQFVPTCLTKDPATKFPTLRPNVSPLVVHSVPLPIEIETLIERNVNCKRPMIGSFDKLYWIHDNTQLYFWRYDNTAFEACHNSTQSIRYVAMGLLEGVMSYSNEAMLIVAIATTNKISLYNYKQNFLDQLNISVNTSNEIVTWMEVNKAGVYYGGNEGTLKVIRLNSSKKWKVEDGSFLPLLKNPLFRQLFMSQTMECVRFSNNMKIAYCLLTNQYSENWLSRRLFWQDTEGIEKEIKVYDLNNKMEVLCSIKENRIIEALRSSYRVLANVSYERLRIINIYVDETNLLNIALSGGYHVKLQKPISLEFTNLVHLISIEATNRVYNIMQTGVCQDLSSPFATRFPEYLGGFTSQSLGVNNLSIMANPLRFVYVDEDGKSVSNVDPTSSGSLNNEEEHIVIQNLKKRHYILDEIGQLVELQNQQKDLGEILHKTVFGNRKQWLYFSGKLIKKISKLRLMDVTLGMIQIYQDVLLKEFSDPNMKPAYMYDYLGEFVQTHGVVNICQCLLEIVLNRSIRYVLKQDIYHNTAMKFYKQPTQLPAKIMFCLGSKIVENTVEMRFFAEELLARLSRDVSSTNEGTDKEDILWQVLLKYYHTLYGEIKNQPMSFFRKNQKLSMQVREKLQVFKRFLVKKYHENTTVNMRHRLAKVKQESEIEEVMRKQNETYVMVIPLRFAIESTSTLMYYMAATIEKINLLLEIFTRIGAEGVNITIDQVLTDRTARQNLKQIILLQNPTGNFYFDQVQKILPQVLTRSDVYYSIWEGRTESEQLKAELKDIMVHASQQRLLRVFKLYRTQKGGYSRTIEMLLHRLSQLTMREYVGQIQQIHTKGQLATEIEKAEREEEEYHRNITMNMIKIVLEDLLRWAHHTKDPVSLLESNNCFNICREYVAKRKLKQNNRTMVELQNLIDEKAKQSNMPILTKNTVVLENDKHQTGLKSLLLSAGLHKSNQLLF